MFAPFSPCQRGQRAGKEPLSSTTTHKFELAMKRRFEYPNPAPTFHVVNEHSFAMTHSTHQKPAFSVCLGFAVAAFLPALSAANILNVVETGGDNEPTDTITAKWTGVTFNTTIANEPTLNTPVGTSYTVGTFGSGAPAFIDRAHRYLDDPGTGGPALPVPAYLTGLEYVMSGNDNRENPSYRLDITLASPSVMYLLVDNRLSDANSANPPTFDATHMQWVLDQGWKATSHGLNRAGNVGVPDEVGFDEGADGTINQWYSVYEKSVPGGTFSVFQADNAGQNMYGVAVAAIPEPGTVAMTALGIVGVLMQRRHRRA